MREMLATNSSSEITDWAAFFRLQDEAYREATKPQERDEG